jgi:hypothetical protein
MGNDAHASFQTAETKMKTGSFTHLIGEPTYSGSQNQR